MKTKPLLLIALSVFLLLKWTENPVMAQTYGGGSGTAVDPYRISTTQHMIELRNMVNNNSNSYEGKHFKLAANIDLGNESWTPISGFSGSFDGDGHTIKGLLLDKIRAGSGLFSSITISNGTAYFKNLCLEGNINIPNPDGGSVAVGTYGTLIGKIILTNNASYTIENCYNSVPLNTNKAPIMSGVGGIIGCLEGRSSSVTANIISCTNNGVVSGDYGGGGIIGSVYGLGSVNIASCMNKSPVTGNGSFGRAGGIVGLIACWASVSTPTGLAVSIKSCTNSGLLTGNTGSHMAGGIVGHIYNDNGSFGYIPVPQLNINYCYHYAGTSGSKTGSIIGTISDHTKVDIRNCYWLREGSINNGVNAIGEQLSSNVTVEGSTVKYLNAAGFASAANFTSWTDFEYPFYDNSRPYPIGRVIPIPYEPCITMTSTATSSISINIIKNGDRKMWIDWGDGIKKAYTSTTTSVSGQAIFTKEIPTGSKNIRIYGEDVLDLTRYNCQLTVLDVGNCTTLTGIQCSYNNITTLDVSKNTKLTSLYCFNNKLSALDVSKNIALIGLDLSNNQLSALDVSKNTTLTNLACNSNQLTALDVSKNTKLTKLNCGNNKLTSLDVTKNTLLTVLECGANQLTALNITQSV